MRFTLLTLAAACLLAASCTNGYIEGRPDANGRYHRTFHPLPPGTTYYDDSFIIDVNQCIEREESTGYPWLDHQSPKQFWQAYYQRLRSVKNPLPSGRFRKPEEKVAFIKQKLREHGLPTYD